MREETTRAVIPGLSLPMLFASLLAVCAMIVDVRSRRIPNWLTGGGLLLGLTGTAIVAAQAEGVAGLLTGALSAATGAALGFAMLFPFYVIRVRGAGHAIGAGDVKLLAALGAVVGPHTLVSVALYGMLAGAAQSIVMLARRRRASLTSPDGLAIDSPASTVCSERAPYAVALAAGVFLTLFMPPLVRF